MLAGEWLRRLGTAWRRWPSWKMVQTWWIRVCLGFVALAGAFSTLQLRHWWPEDSLIPRQPLCANGQRLAVYGLASSPSARYPIGQTFQVRVRAP